MYVIFNAFWNVEFVIGLLLYFHGCSFLITWCYGLWLQLMSTSLLNLQNSKLLTVLVISYMLMLRSSKSSKYVKRLLRKKALMSLLLRQACLASGEDWVFSCVHCYCVCVPEKALLQVSIFVVRYWKVVCLVNIQYCEAACPTSIDQVNTSNTHTHCDWLSSTPHTGLAYTCCFLQQRAIFSRWSQDSWSIRWDWL